MIFKGNYIGGHFQKPQGNVQTLLSEDPGDLDHPVGTFAFSEEEVERAVAAAQAGFSVWREKPFTVRRRAILQFHKALRRRREELAQLITREMGKPIRDALQEVDRMIERVPLASKEAGRLSEGKSYPLKRGVRGVLRYKPRGILAIIGPFNFPGHIPNSQILPAILLGNSVIFKPSEFTPFVGQLLAELWHETGLPRGIFNLVQGDGRVGKTVVAHEKIHGIIFTGSYATGQKIREETVHQVDKLVALEMGGKNAAIVSRHAGLQNAVENCLLGSFSISGQRCNATSRIILEKKIAKPFLKSFMDKAKSVTVGYGLDEKNFMGPLVSQDAVEKYLYHTALAPKENFEVLQKGIPLEKERRGYYVQPSVCLREVKKGETPRGPYTEEEIFGPNVAIYIVDALEEAVRIHNASRYGLIASFFSKRKEEYEKIFRELEVGLLNWNQATIYSSARLPFGGVKRSGNHHPVGAFVPHLCTYPVAVLEKPFGRRD
ncbi:MAG: aldehyde dehydrogenase family protein [Candidatus Omnitrophica bacterium]|nr:aldehyde dehydrogenase family protein [Candidatus Omnitrophota bacterium]